MRAGRSKIVLGLNLEDSRLCVRIAPFAGTMSPVFSPRLSRLPASPENHFSEENLIYFPSSHDSPAAFQAPPTTSGSRSPAFSPSPSRVSAPFSPRRWRGAFALYTHPVPATGDCGAPLSCMWADSEPAPKGQTQWLQIYSQTSSSSFKTEDTAVHVDSTSCWALGGVGEKSGSFRTSITSPTARKSQELPRHEAPRQSPST